MNSNYNVEAQEKVVTAIWEFARNYQSMPHDCKQEGGKDQDDMTMPLKAVRIAMKDIMSAFGYEVYPLQ